MPRSTSLILEAALDATGRSSRSKPVVSNLNKPLDKLERLLRERTEATLGLVSCKEGEEPKGVDASRLVVMLRVYVELSYEEPEKSARFNRKLDYPTLGIV